MSVALGAALAEFYEQRARNLALAQALERALMQVRHPLSLALLSQLTAKGPAEDAVPPETPVASDLPACAARGDDQRGHDDRAVPLSTLATPGPAVPHVSQEKMPNALQSPEWEDMPWTAVKKGRKGILTTERPTRPQQPWDHRKAGFLLLSEDERHAQQQSPGAICPAPSEQAPTASPFPDTTTLAEHHDDPDLSVHSHPTGPQKSFRQRQAEMARLEKAVLEEAIAQARQEEERLRAPPPKEQADKYSLEVPNGASSTKRQQRSASAPSSDHNQHGVGVPREEAEKAQLQCEAKNQHSIIHPEAVGPRPSSPGDPVSQTCIQRQRPSLVACRIAAYETGGKDPRPTTSTTTTSRTAADLFGGVG